MSTIRDLQQTAETIAGLGLLEARLLRPAEAVDGQASRPAWLEIKTAIPRPPNVGGGFVTWRGYIDGTDREHLDKLNLLLGLLMEITRDVGPLLAAVRNAFRNADVAREARRRTEARLAGVMQGSPNARGTFFVRVDAQGQAWLQDPIKRDGGLGFVFPTLADLWRAHPELRPVRWGDDETGPCLFVEAFSMQESM